MGFDGILNFYADRDKVCDLEFEREFCKHTEWKETWAAPYTVNADAELVERIGRDDMVRGFTIAAVGFYAPQGRMVRLKLADPNLNEKNRKLPVQRSTDYKLRDGISMSPRYGKNSSDTVR